MRDSQSLLRHRRCRSRCLPCPVTEGLVEFVGVAGARARGVGRVLGVAGAGARSGGAVSVLPEPAPEELVEFSVLPEPAPEELVARSVLPGPDAGGVGRVLGVAGAGAGGVGRVLGVAGAGAGDVVPFPVLPVPGARRSRVARCARTGRRRCRRRRVAPAPTAAPLDGDRRMAAAGRAGAAAGAPTTHAPGADRSSQNAPRRADLGVCSSDSPRSCSARCASIAVRAFVRTMTTIRRRRPRPSHRRAS